MTVIYIFGNGNTSFEDFQKYYCATLLELVRKSENQFLLSDFRGVDTLTMEFLKNKSSKVTILHIGERPRYYPDLFKTKVSEWTVIGGFNSDSARDNAAVDLCTHFLAVDFNSNDNRKSGTARNIDLCISRGKLFVGR